VTHEVVKFLIIGGVIIPNLNFFNWDIFINLFHIYIYIYLIIFMDGPSTHMVKNKNIYLLYVTWEHMCPCYPPSPKNIFSRERTKLGTERG
jgi:hypothetical protein